MSHLIRNVGHIHSAWESKGQDTSSFHILGSKPLEMHPDTGAG